MISETLKIPKDKLSEYLNKDGSFTEKALAEFTARFRVKLREGLRALYVQEGDKVELIYKFNIEI